jgi:hypothetical protein
MRSRQLADQYYPSYRFVNQPEIVSVASPFDQGSKPIDLFEGFAHLVGNDFVGMPLFLTRIYQGSKD